MKVAINGFGRIGRLVFKLMSDEVVAINDLASPKELAYLLKYDSVHRMYHKQVDYDEENIIVDGRKIKVYAEKDPINLPWKELDIDMVMECTGFFTSLEASTKHIEAGAKKVIISAPAKGDLKTIVYDVNHQTLTNQDKVISAASCTTNCLAPVLNTLHKNYKIKNGFMTTIHATTNNQAILDKVHKKGMESRRGRAGYTNTIPTTTGAAKAINAVIPELKDKIKGSAIRVPVYDGSMIELFINIEGSTTKETLQNLYVENQSETLACTYDPIVSSDVISTRCGAVVDLSLIEVVDNNYIKILAWYDNEMGYSMQMVRTARYFNEIK